MFLKNRNISSKIKRSKVTDYAALKQKSPLLQNIKIFHNCVCEIENSVLRINAQHQEPCQVTKKKDTKGHIFLYHPHPALNLGFLI